MLNPLYPKICKYCGSHFQSKVANKAYCAPECRITYLKSNYRCKYHGALSEGEIRIRRADTNPQGVCRLCEKNAKKTEAGRAAGRETKRKWRERLSEEKRQQVRDKAKDWASKRTSELWDSYIIEELTRDSKILKENVTKELIEVKRLEILIKRSARGTAKGRYKAYE